MKIFVVRICTWQAQFPQVLYSIESLVPCTDGPVRNVHAEEKCDRTLHSERETDMALLEQRHADSKQLAAMGQFSYHLFGGVHHANTYAQPHKNICKLTINEQIPVYPRTSILARSYWTSVHLYCDGLNSNFSNLS